MNLCKYKRLIIIFVFVCVRFLPVFCQLPVGAWRDHLSWNTAEIVVVADKKAYCSNGVGLLSYDMTNRNLEKQSKVNGLSDAGITAIQYASAFDAIVVGYANGNVDIIDANNKVYNISNIKQTDLFLNKRINHIYVSGDYAYLSCSFGIATVDLKLRRIRDIFIIGDNGDEVNVSSMTEYAGYFYAATLHGLKRADKTSSMLNTFEVWEKIDDAPDSNGTIVASEKYLYVYDSDSQIFFYDKNSWKQLTSMYPHGTIRRLSFAGDYLFVNATNGVFIYNANNNTLYNTIQTLGNNVITACDATIDSEGTIWIADNRQGLVRWRSVNDISYFAPNGPTSNYATAMRFKADRLFVAAGGKDRDGNPLNRQGEIYTFYANQWTTISPDGAFDFTDVDISEKQPDTYYVTSWGGGLYVLENGLVKEHYTQHNSSLTENYWGNLLCGGLLIDSDNKIWLSNDKNICLFDKENWKKLQLETSSSFGRFTGDNFGQIWTTQGSKGLMVFNKTASEQAQTDASISFKPYNYLYTAEIDISNNISNTPDGSIWVATTQGPVYYPNPSVILNGEGTGGVHVLRTGNTEPDRLYPLLGDENILSVAIDGAYRKWFGTETAGVFLIDEDNKGEIRHFTAENSPLLSNRVHDIAINDKTGEVYLATEFGIIGYRSDAVASGDDFKNVYAFPSPVRPGYDGEITITGLIKDVDVKITDIAGNLVYQTRSLGGMAVWNGRNQQGRKVASGVYLVFCTNDDGSKTHVTKILVVR